MYRAVNIALVNELKIVFAAMGIDIWEVLDAAAIKPFGFQRFDPGPGWGGHCIPIDPFYLSWRARQVGEQARFIELAGQTNIEVTRWVLDRLEKALAARGRKLRGAKILVLGAAYKENVADSRESPGFVILDLLRRKGAEIHYHDPLIPRLPRTRRWPELEGLESAPLTAERLTRVDAVVVVTAHYRIDFDLVQQHAPLIIDTRGVYPAGTDRVVRG